MSTVVELRPAAPLVVSKRELARILDRSERWVESMAAKGMPVLPDADRFGRRRYDVGACRAWVQAGKTAPKQDRTTLLEARVAVLERIVQEQLRKEQT